MLIVTSLFSSFLTAIYIKLALNVISLRHKNKVSLGSGGHSDLQKAIRAHGNFSEYVPIGLVLMGCLELNGAPWWLVSFWGTTLSSGRLFHAVGIKQDKSKITNRVRGMKITLNTLIGLIASNIGYLIFRLINSI